MLGNEPCAVLREAIASAIGALCRRHTPAGANANVVEAVIAGLEISRIVGYRHGGASERPCAHTLYFDEFLGSELALRKLGQESSRLSVGMRPTAKENSSA